MSIYQRLRLLGLDVIPPFMSRAISKHLISRLERFQASHPGSLPANKRFVRTIAELDQMIALADEAGSKSDDALRQVFATFDYTPDLSNLPQDPFSDGYRSFQMALYDSISGRSGYTPIDHEQTPFDLDAAIRAPFPYLTRSTTTVGDQLIMQGVLLRALNLSPNSTVLEFGPGWGNTTLHMAQLGLQVTAVDVYQGFVDLIDARAKQLGLSISTHCANMLEFDSHQKYDAVVFFECFHHCSDHHAMLKKLHSLIKENGVVVFAGEPIANNLPYPWGVRLDGMAVWSIRKFGWLELGFQADYFDKALAQSGWKSQTLYSRDVPYMSVITARKANA